MDKHLTESPVDSHQEQFRCSTAQGALAAQRVFGCVIDILETGYHSVYLSVAGNAHKTSVWCRRSPEEDVNLTEAFGEDTGSSADGIEKNVEKPGSSDGK